MPRFILLEHVDAPDDPAGLHHDLLLEAGTACRTWRLAAALELDGPAVTAVEIPPHRLAWLECETAEVSGGRGRVRRLRGGDYAVLDCDAADLMTARRIVIALGPGPAADRLRLDATGGAWRATLVTDGGGMMAPPPET